MSAPAIELDGIWVALGGHWVLEAIDLAVPRGDYLAVIGPNGSGKSTLLKVILGLIRPDRGEVRVLGTTPRKARGRVGYVPQYAGFDPGFPIRVLDAVKTGRLAGRGLLRARKGDDDRIARQALERVEAGHLADRPIRALSGGQQERVMIARALAVEPEVLVLDEPTASLDTRTADSFYDLLAHLNEDMTVVLVSHDVGTVSRRVRTIACLNRQLVSHPSHQLTADMVEEVYGCPIDLIAHGHPHRVLEDHGGEG